MKNKILILLLFIFWAFKVYSQDLTLGLKGGLDIVSTIETYNNQTYPSRPSYHLELFGKYDLNNTFQIQIEPGFIEKGTWTSSSKDWKYKYGYLTLPTFLIYKPFKRLNIEIGSDFNYLIYANLKESDGNEVVEDTFQEYYNHFEISVIAGISYDLLKNGQIGFRFGRGLTKIYYDTPFFNADHYSHYKFYNRYLEFFTRISLFRYNLKN